MEEVNSYMLCKFEWIERFIWVMVLAVFQIFEMRSLVLRFRLAFGTGLKHKNTVANSRVIAFLGKLSQSSPPFTRNQCSRSSLPSTTLAAAGVFSQGLAVKQGQPTSKTDQKPAAMVVTRNTSTASSNKLFKTNASQPLKKAKHTH